MTTVEVFECGCSIEAETCEVLYVCEKCRARIAAENYIEPDRF